MLGFGGLSWDEYINGEDYKDDCTLDVENTITELPLINILDPNSIRSVGAFNRCVFRFGENVSNSYQGLFVSILMAVFLGLLAVAGEIYIEKNP